MSLNTPIYAIAKELNIDSDKVILACKTLGINAKGATKRLNKEDSVRVRSYFENGKNVSQEIIDINKNNVKTKTNSKKIEPKTKQSYFPNRLIGKSWINKKRNRKYIIPRVDKRYKYLYSYYILKIILNYLSKE